jgi:AraC-like DNA-binding protein
MNDLWMVGFTGAAVGAALGWPLLRVPNARLLGSLLLFGGVAAAMIAASHGNLFPDDVAGLTEHIVSAGNLVFWAALVIWVRSAMRRDTPTHVRAAVIAVPLIAYAAYVIDTTEPPPFLLMLPVGTAASTYVFVLWLRDVERRGEGLSGDLLTRMVVLAVAMNTAQALRTFFADVDALREIVPITMTASFLSIATLAVRSMMRVDAPPPAKLRPDASAPRYAKSALDDSAASALLKALDEGMRSENWYRNSSLSLNELATRLHTRPHLLSQALNQVRGTSLHDYLQSWRVAEARRLLADPGSDRFTIDALAESAGFASRSAFYKAFKAREGVTPTEFRQRTRAR